MIACIAKRPQNSSVILLQKDSTTRTVSLSTLWQANALNYSVTVI